MTYERVRKLGQGFFGDVYLEMDTNLNRFVAAKYLNDNAAAAGLDAAAEARSMLESSHDNVVMVYSVDDDGHDKVVRMEYLPNGSIQDRSGGKALPSREAVLITEQACRGVHNLHQRGLLHRDIKPGNLLAGPDGSIKVSDFGLSCSQEAEDPAGFGYYCHLPPEDRKVGYTQSIAGDIYALGATAYRLLNGDSFTGLIPRAKAPTTWSIQSDAIIDPTLWRPHVTKRVRKAVVKALQADPERRYQSAADFRRALEQARPDLSWNASDAYHWEGVETGASHHWKVDVAAQAGELFEIMVRRGRSGGKLRRVSDLSGAAKGSLELYQRLSKVTEST